MTIEKRSNELYISMDVETDGPIPGINSMLSFGAVAFRNGQIIGAHYTNLLPISNGVQNPDTMAFWAKHTTAWNHIHNNLKYPQISPAKAMRGLVNWLATFKKRPVFVAYPAGFDFTFIYWYLIAFAGYSPFGFSALDMKSFAMAITGKTFRDTVKRRMPKSWFIPQLPHNHCALDDALEQGRTFMRMLELQGMTLHDLDLSIVDAVR